MRIPFRSLVAISRPRFYTYVCGTFIVGVAAGSTSISQFYSLIFLFFLLFFTFPANFFLYGVNDIFDTETDAQNPKKSSREHRLQREEHSIVAALCSAIALAAVAVLPLLTLTQAALLAFFILLAASYSAPPIRAKAIPFLDAYSNVLYALPGYFGYALLTNTVAPLPFWILGLCWTAGMHTFSAIPDIAVDKATKITTTAVLLGERNALLFVLINWFSAATVGSITLGAAGLLLYIYPVLALLLLLTKKAAGSIYWWFPIINASIGFLAFWYILITRFGLEALWNALPFLS